MEKKILIVDDDMVFRKYMKSIIEENFSEVQIREAQSGAYALRLLDQEEIDIILTDISMPQMSGIELVQALHEKNWTLPVAILSSYDDFEYVKEGLKLGAIDYLLKHDSEDADICKLIQVCIEKHHAIMEDKRNIVHSERWQLGMACKRFVNDAGEKVQWENAVRDGYLKDYAHHQYYAMCTRNLNYVPLKDAIPEEKRMAFQYLYFYDALDCIVYVIWCNDTQQEATRGLLQMVHHLGEQAQDAFIGVSDLGHDSDNIKRHIDEAVEACLQAKLHAVPSKWYTQIEFTDTKEVVCQMEQLTALFQQGRFNQQEIQRILALVANQMELHYYRRALWESIIRTISHLFLKKMYEEKIPVSDEFIKQAEEIVASVALDEFEQWLQQFWRLYEEKIEALHYTELTIKIMELINQNIFQNISIEEIAAQLNYSENYIGKRFKTDTGLRIKEYINICKINQAKELLSAKQYKTYEVANLLHFSSDAYFCAVFKSVTKMTVKEFLQSMK